MRIERKSSFFLISLTGCLVIYLVLTGCFNNRQLLETPLPQGYFLPNPPTRVWRALFLEASKPTCRILINDEASHILSWVGEVESDDRLHGSLTDPDVVSGDDETIVITVVRVEDSAGGSRLTIRSTYYSDKPFLGVSSSRGNYEQEILRAIRNSMTAEVMSHVKSQ